jgi:hypothetical protein
MRILAPDYARLGSCTSEIDQTAYDQQPVRGPRNSTSPDPVVSSEAAATMARSARGDEANAAFCAVSPPKAAFAHRATSAGNVPVDRVVETRGIEPLTPALQRRCSAN